MKLVLMVLMALEVFVRMGLAAPGDGGSVDAAALPQMPSAAEVAKCLGFPASVHFQVTTAKTSGLFEGFQPLLVCNYSAEKQTPYFYGLEIYPAGSFFGSKRQQQEREIEQFSNDQKKMWEKTKKDALTKNGQVLEGEDRYASLITVETRPDGRKVFFSGYAVGPGGGIIGAFTKVGKYDVVFLQHAFGGDGDDPEESDRISQMASPSRSLPAAFAQLEKAMPIFPKVPETPRPPLTPLPQAAATSAVAAPVPRRLTGFELAQCLELLKPVRFQSVRERRSPIFGQFNPIWVTLYQTDVQFSWGYSVEIYPARTVFGNQRNWLEQWLESHSLQEQKARELARKNSNKTKSKLGVAPSSAVVVRPDGRKVYFHLFTMASGAPAPTVFSTIGNYDVVLTQFSYSTDAEELVARKKVAPRRGMLQAFAKLEALISRK